MDSEDTVAALYPGIEAVESPPTSPLEAAPLDSAVPASPSMTLGLSSHVPNAQERVSLCSPTPPWRTGRAPHLWSPATPAASPAIPLSPPGTRRLTGQPRALVLDSPFRTPLKGASFSKRPSLPLLPPPAPRPPLGRRWSWPLPLSLLLLTVVALGMAGGAFTVLRVPPTYFCDSEGLYAMTWDLNCEGCPHQGYCAFGSLQACEPPTQQHTGVCGVNGRLPSASTEVLRLMRETLATAQCAAAPRRRGLTIPQLQKAVRAALPHIPAPAFTEIWEASVARLGVHPTVYGMRSAVVAGEPGFEWAATSVGDAVQCVGQQLSVGGGYGTAGLLAAAVMAAGAALVRRQRQQIKAV